MVVSTVKERIAKLSESVFPKLEIYTNYEIIMVTPTLQAEIAELYYLRDVDMELNPKQQILWALQKLRAVDDFADLLEDLAHFEGTGDNSAFYKFCSLGALMYLGY